MNPVDQLRPVLPSRVVRRPEDRVQRRETVPGQRDKQKPKSPSGHKRDGTDHIVDELA